MFTFWLSLLSVYPLDVLGLGEVYLQQSLFQPKFSILGFIVEVFKLESFPADVLFAHMHICLGFFLVFMCYIYVRMTVWLSKSKSVN